MSIECKIKGKRIVLFLISIISNISTAKNMRAVRVLFTGTPIPFEFTPLLGVLIGVITALVLVTLVILGALKLKSDRRAQRPGDLPLKKANAPSAEELYDTDDRNPDVVPTNKGKIIYLPRNWLKTPNEIIKHQLIKLRALKLC